MEKAKRLAVPDIRPDVAVRMRQWLGLVLLLLAACSRPDAEQRLRAEFDAMKTAAVERRVGDFMDGVSADFTGNDGADRVALHNMMRLQVLGRSSVGVITGPLEIEMQDATATVRFSAVLSGGSGRFVPDSAQAYSVTSGWREESGEWRIYYAQWKPQL